MDALAALGQLAAAPTQVVVNGQPLPVVIDTITAAILDQNRQLAELREYTYQTNAQQWVRIVAIEASVARLDADVGITQRPLLNGKPSVHSALTSLEQRTVMLESYRKANITSELELATGKGVLKRYMAKWRAFKIAREAAQIMSGRTAEGIMKLYFHKMKNFAIRLNQRRIQQRGLRALFFSSAKNVQRAYFAQWVRYHNLIEKKYEEKRRYNVECANSMATVTSRGVARRFFLRWLTVTRAMQRRDALEETVFGMQQVVSRKLVGIYLRKWRLAERTNRLRRETVERIATHYAPQAFYNLGRTAVQKWSYWARWRSKRRHMVSLVPRMHHLQCIRLALRYFVRLRTYRDQAEGRRYRHQLEQEVLAVRRRCDRFAQELDVGLKVIQRSNTVLLKIASDSLSDTDKKALQDAWASATTRFSASAANVAASEVAEGFAVPQYPPAARVAAADLGFGAPNAGRVVEDSSDDDDAALTDARIQELMAKAHLVARGQRI